MPTYTTISAGSVSAISLAASSTLKLSGAGTAQLVPPGVPGTDNALRTVSGELSFGPYPIACTVLANAAPSSNGLRYYTIGATDAVPPGGAQSGSGPLPADSLQGLVSDDGIQAPAAPPTAAVGAAGVLTGAYYYSVTFVTALGETAPWAGTATVVNPSAQQVNLTNIPVGPAGTTARRIYRTPATPVDPKDYRFLAEISDNTTTTYTDNIADGSLGNPANWGAANRGKFKDAAGVRFAAFSDQSTALGQGTFNANTGYASTAIGYQSQYSVTSGRRNVSVGTYSLTGVTSGYQNTAIGVHSGQSLTTQRSNTFAGFSAGFYAGSGSGAAQYNVAIGDGAMYGTSGIGIGSSNTAVGYQALLWGSAAAALDNCIGIGALAGQFANNNRQLYIDTQASVRATAAASQNEGLIFGEIPNSGNVQTQGLKLNALVRLGSSTSPTVANLPAASAAYQGFRRYVTDSTVAASGNYGATVAGGGSNCVPVFCTGSAWIIA